MDESIHGVFVGLIAQELYDNLSAEEQIEVDVETYDLLQELMENEDSYTEDVYSEVGLVGEVKAFVKYNANKALMNLGKDSFYEEQEINPIVLNGLSVETRTHDFFSKKGNGYQLGIVAPITDETFAFVNELLGKKSA